MTLPQYQIDEWFAAPKKEPSQDKAIEDILTASRILAETINRHIPDGDEKMVAMQHVVTAEAVERRIADGSFAFIGGVQ